ncbi:MAG: MerR family transcriptional regulator [Deltaproteobacteria bacterium]|nr:MerR family transcriptional regulator [Deltaproteobacteria bacterium]
MPPRLPDKLYFKIGEVARIVGVKPYVLRYWETEFELLKPGKAPSRHRMYKKRDVELLLEIKRLLYAEGFTIEGARKKLKEVKIHLQERPLEAQERTPVAEKDALLAPDLSHPSQFSGSEVHSGPSRWPRVDHGYASLNGLMLSRVSAPYGRQPR